MTNKLNKTKELNKSDFITSPNGHEFNGVKLGSIAEFYEVSDKEKETLFKVSNGIKLIYENMEKGELSVTEYLQEIESLNQLLKNLPRISLTMNNKK